MRKCREGYKIGPLFADTYEIAEALFQALITNAKGQAVYIDVPEPNLNAKKLIEKYQMTEVFYSRTNVPKWTTLIESQ